jgi:hypothetical protein
MHSTACRLAVHSHTQRQCLTTIQAISLTSRGVHAVCPHHPRDRGGHGRCPAKDAGSTGLDHSHSDGRCAQLASHEGPQPHRLRFRLAEQQDGQGAKAAQQERSAWQL